MCVNNFAQTVSPSRKRICLVGTGSIAHAHAEAIQNIPGLLLTTVVDTDGGKARQFAARWGVEHVYTRIDEALERRSFDRAHVAVPPDAHAAVTLQLLDALVPTFVEKPLASTAAEANRLVRDGTEVWYAARCQPECHFPPCFSRAREASG